jgi:hypothetical protein
MHSCTSALRTVSLVVAQWVVGDHMEAEIAPRECLDALLHVGAADGLAGGRQSLLSLVLERPYAAGFAAQLADRNGGRSPKGRALMPALDCS